MADLLFACFLHSESVWWAGRVGRRPASSSDAVRACHLDCRLLTTISANHQSRLGTTARLAMYFGLPLSALRAQMARVGHSTDSAAAPGQRGLISQCSPVYRASFPPLPRTRRTCGLCTPSLTRYVRFRPYVLSADTERALAMHSGHALLHSDAPVRCLAIARAQGAIRVIFV